MLSMTRVDAVIVNYHQPRLAADAARSVLNSRGIAPRVILVENEGDGEWARGEFSNDPRVTVIANAANAGFGPACNQGIERALAGDAEFVLLLNSDALVEPDAIARLAGPAKQNGMAAPKILLADGTIYSAGGIVELARARCRNRGIYEQDSGQYDRAETMPFASACALLIARRALETGARFYEPYFLYYEDADLCLTLGRAGFSVAYEPSATAVHLESASSSSRPHLDYYDARNRWLFLKRRPPGPQKIIGMEYLTAIIFIKILKLFVSGRLSRARALARGFLDGLAGRFGPMPR
ncbi:glycosyltransferase family 2 protein [bacterium]|nr:glycosyltransferase family 2 protein [bacterium]